MHSSSRVCTSGLLITPRSPLLLLRSPQQHTQAFHLRSWEEVFFFLLPLIIPLLIPRMLVGASRACAFTLASRRVFRLHPRFLSNTKTSKNRPLLPYNESMSEQPPSPSQEGRVTATQDDIDRKQEELDAELQEVSLLRQRVSRSYNSIPPSLNLVHPTCVFVAECITRGRKSNTNTNSFRAYTCGVRV